MVSKEQRRKQLARAKFERQQQRRANRHRRGRRRRILLSVALVVLVAGGATALVAVNRDDGGSDPAAEDNAQPSDEPTTPLDDPCEAPAEGEPTTAQWEEQPEMAVDAANDYVMRLATTCGDIEITMDAEAAPQTVNSFNFLAGEGYFDHTRCHRLVTEGIYVLQCGDPQGTGQGGPGYSLPDENLDAPEVADGVYPAGTVAMANSGPDTGGSQFFVVYEDSQLPAQYTPFGTLTAGLDVVELIAGTGAAPPDANGTTAPNATVVINEATVEEVAAE
ncbi:peptidylprolyl isomerase [Streptomyces radicis]|uniref:Peptidyl-prolyl cis-trans isomerase n=1 Tax=Streptomyces radicis TaxID=1750517 RepID=A0A3A9WI21_9ACTN|nr:peptidylprolyl isomerase [Streptomyces radicis]RKN12668.1 peptidylprolyl isomerase [Streptomyces radicis]RKN27568.1 peptidylprolyl isomerase [Streptomyces radicis]